MLITVKDACVPIVEFTPVRPELQERFLTRFYIKTCTAGQYSH